MSDRLHSGPVVERALRLARRLLPARTVIVHGFYGMGNVGDEAILAATLRTIRERTDLEPLVFAWGPEAVRSDHGVRSLDPRASKTTALRAVLGARAFLLGGGGLIKDFGGGPESLGRWLHWLDVARHLGVQTMTWSVGVGEVVHPESTRRVREVLGRVDVVTVRDDASAVRLDDLGLSRDVVVTADPAVGLGRSWRGRRAPDGRLHVVACPRHLYTEAAEVTRPDLFENLLDAFASVLDHVQAAHGARVTFLPMRTRGKADDREVCHQILQRMRCRDGVEVVEDDAPSVEGALAHLSHADLQVGMRLHAAVLAAAVGVPSVAVAYQPKVRAFMEGLGLGAYCAEVEGATGAWMTERADAALAEQGRLGEALKRRTDRMASAYEQNGALLEGLIGRAQCAPPQPKP